MNQKDLLNVAANMLEAAAAAARAGVSSASVPAGDGGAPLVKRPDDSPTPEAKEGPTPTDGREGWRKLLIAVTFPEMGDCMWSWWMTPDRKWYSGNYACPNQPWGNNQSTLDSFIVKERPGATALDVRSKLSPPPNLSDWWPPKEPAPIAGRINPEADAQTDGKGRTLVQIDAALDDVVARINAAESKIDRLVAAHVPTPATLRGPDPAAGHNAFATDVEAAEEKDDAYHELEAFHTQCIEKIGDLLGVEDGETLEEAAARLVKERDEARAEVAAMKADDEKWRGQIVVEQRRGGKWIPCSPDRKWWVSHVGTWVEETDADSGVYMEEDNARRAAANVKEPWPGYTP